jgi:hypothetical protein
LKTSSSPLCSFLLFAVSTFAFAAPKSTDAPVKSDPQWNVTVSVLMVAMPQEKMLPMIPDLRDPKKIDGAVDRLLAAVQNKEAILTGYPMVVTDDGERAVSESVIEQRYATEFDPPANAQNFGGGPAASGTSDSIFVHDDVVPTAFETRNCGATLEAEPHVLNHGESIHLDLVPQRVELLNFTSRSKYKVDQPIFFTSKVIQGLTVHNGQRVLIAVHQIPKPENFIEVFVLQASDTPVDTH